MILSLPPRRSWFLFFFLLLGGFGATAQAPRGTIVVRRFTAPSLRNPGGENPERRVTVYLPPGYQESKERYPVLYYLHGFLWSDSLLIARDHFNALLDKAIHSGRIRPLIVVMPDESGLYGGSFYSNSALTGHWTDFTARDLVGWVDTQFRTIATREGRGLAGHSMGGHGALKTAMLYPRVFAAVYALSPAVLGFARELSPDNETFRRAAQPRTKEALAAGNDFFTLLLVALGRAWSPDMAAPPFFARLPLDHRDGVALPNEEVNALWRRNMPLYMLDRYADSLRQLAALRLDWGRNDEFRHIPETALQFSKKLEALGIPHGAEEYVGTHGSEIGTPEGRLLTELLPFFDRQLQFGAAKGR